MTRWRIPAVLVLLALAGGGALLFVSRSRRMALGPTGTTAATPRRIDIPDQADHWAAQGFVEMVPPIRLPSTPNERDWITVWLKVPEGKTIATRYLPDQGRHTLKFPPGTEADRVELWRIEGHGEAGARWTVLDVRGTRLGDAGEELFHVYLPVTSEPLAPLFGYEWTRGATETGQAATELYTEFLETASWLQDEGRPPPDDVRRERIRKFRQRNECSTCHRHNKPLIRRRDEGIALARPTDENGFYGVTAVLTDTVPLESHRPREMNVGVPFVQIRCDTGEPRLLESSGGTRQYVCQDGEVPLGHLDLRAALAAGDERAQGVCRSRRYLHDRMDPEGRSAFQEAFAACGISEPSPPRRAAGP